MSWSPDGKNIAFWDRKSPKDPTSIWLLSVETLEKKQMTAPDASSRGDLWPAFSPDGRYLAFIRWVDYKPALYVMRLPRGEPALVTAYNDPTTQCWTADSREIVFASSMYSGETALWRIFVDGGEVRTISHAWRAGVSAHRQPESSGLQNPDLQLRYLETGVDWA